MTFDLRKAQKAEDGEPFPFTVDGEVFTFPAPLAIDWHVMAAIAEGELAQAVKMLLGDEDFARFDKIPLTLADLNALFEAYGRSAGIDVGESLASTGS